MRNDLLTDDDWAQLEQLATALTPFKFITKRMEGNAGSAHHGSIWEALPGLEYLMQKMEQGRVQTENLVIAASYQNAWEVLQKYYNLTDDNIEIYAAAVLLNPAMRKVYFDRHWTVGELPGYIPIVIQHCRDVWQRHYRDTAVTTPLREPSEFDQFLYEAETIPGDEFDQFILGQPIPITYTAELEILAWWNKSKFTTLRPYAFDLLSVPAMSAECERVFSSTKRLITQDSNRLADDIIEATECLKAWWSRKIIPGA